MGRHLILGAVLYREVLEGLGMLWTGHSYAGQRDQFARIVGALAPALSGACCGETFDASLPRRIA
jgi:hypothetical protein